MGINSEFAKFEVDFKQFMKNVDISISQIISTIHKLNNKILNLDLKIAKLEGKPSGEIINHDIEGI